MSMRRGYEAAASKRNSVTTKSNIQTNSQHWKGIGNTMDRKHAPLYITVASVVALCASQASAQQKKKAEPPPAQLCVPGIQIECACVAKGHGVQVCALDGRSFGDCTGCPDANSPPPVAPALVATNASTFDPASLRLRRNEPLAAGVALFGIGMLMSLAGTTLIIKAGPYDNGTMAAGGLLAGVGGTSALIGAIVAAVGARRIASIPTVSMIAPQFAPHFTLEVGQAKLNWTF